MSNSYHKWHNKKIEPNNMQTTSPLSSLAQQTGAVTLSTLAFRDNPNSGNLFKTNPSPLTTQRSPTTLGLKPSEASNLFLRSNSLQFMGKKTSNTEVEGVKFLIIY